MARYAMIMSRTRKPHPHARSANNNNKRQQRLARPIVLADSTSPRPIVLAEGVQHASAMSFEHLDRIIAEESEDPRCGRCLNHGKSALWNKEHKPACPHKACACKACKEVKTRFPRCAKCREHGVEVSLKGHKEKCPCNPCVCFTCKLVDERRHVMSKQIKQRRHTENEEKSKGVVPPRAFKRPIELPAAEQAPPSPPVLQSAELSSASAFTPTVPSPGASLAMGPSPSRAICGTDIPRLEESFKKICALFGSQSPTFFWAMTVALLKENDYDVDVVKRKVHEGEKDLQQLTSTLKYSSSLPSPPSSYTPSYVSSYGSPSPSLLSSPYHPSLPCYPHLLPSFPGYSLYHGSSGFPLPEPSAAAGPVVAAANLAYYPSTEVVRFTPPVRPGEASGGDSRGSAEYKYDSDGDRESSAASSFVAAAASRKRPREESEKELNLTSASIENLRKQSRNHRAAFEHYGGSLAMGMADMRETAANA